MNKKTGLKTAAILLVLLAVVFTTNKGPVLISQVASLNAQRSNINTVSVNTDASMLPAGQQVIANIPFADYHSRFGPLPDSLRGTLIPINFTLDETGHLQVTRSIKNTIDYFLAANAQESIDKITTRIEELFNNHLSEPALNEALQVLAQYIEYKNELQNIEVLLAQDNELSGSVNSYQQMFQYRREARMKYLSQTVYDAFYADSDKQDSYTASLLAINKNASISNEEKAWQARALESMLPPSQRQAKRIEHQREELQQDIKQAKNRGASQEEIFQLRSSVYDYATAERMAKADEKKSLWQDRFSEYRQYRAMILVVPGMADEDKEYSIQTFQRDNFTGLEIKRLNTLNRMADIKAAQ